MTELVNRKEITVRFSENDPMGVVWHGNYLKYLEDGRESFGLQFGLGYADYYKSRLMAPIVKISCSYKSPLRFGESAVVITTYRFTESAKIVFDYRIVRKEKEEIILEAETVQVFTDLEGKLLIAHPEFYAKWKYDRGFPV